MLFPSRLVRGGLILACHVFSVSAVADGNSGPTDSRPNAVDVLDIIDPTNIILHETEHRVVEVPFPGLSLPAAQGNQTAVENGTDDRLSRRDGPARLKFLFTHGSIELGNFSWTATTVDPLQLRQALDDMLAEARRRPAGELKSYFRLDARNLTLVFHADPSDSGAPAAFVWGHVVRAVSDMSEDARRTPTAHRAYVGKVQDAQAQVLARVAIMPAFVELRSQRGVLAEHSDGDRDASRAGRRPLMDGSWRNAHQARPVWLRDTGLSLTWSEGPRMLGGLIPSITEAVNIALGMVASSSHRYFESIVAEINGVTLVITSEPGLERRAVWNLLFAIYEIVIRQMWIRLGPARNYHGRGPGAIPISVLRSLAWNVLGGAIRDGPRLVGLWYIQPRATGEQGCESNNCVRGWDEL